MNAYDTQLDVLKFLQGAQLDDAFTFVSRHFKAFIEVRRDQLPLRVLHSLCVDVRKGSYVQRRRTGSQVVYEVTIEDKYLPTRAQT